MERIKGYINLFKVDGMLQTNCGLYETKDKAIESGKCGKGYIGTIEINFEYGGNNNGSTNN